MSNILIYTDHLKGHIIPALEVAYRLKKHGYNVSFFGIHDAMIEVSKTEFNVHVIFEKYYPLNSMKTPQKNNESPVRLIFEGEIDDLIHKINPKLIFLTAHDPVESLALYLKYNIRTAIIWSHFPFASTPLKNGEVKIVVGNSIIYNDCENKSPFTLAIKDIFKELVFNVENPDRKIILDYIKKQGEIPIKDLAKVFDNFYNFIVMSKELLIDNLILQKNDIYLGSCIYQHNIFGVSSKDFFNKIPQHRLDNKKIIYCSMGSWADEINSNKASIVFDKFIACMASENLRDFNLVLVAGNLIDKYENLNLPENVNIYKWVPQTEILKYSSIAIIHGGMGSIKDCILAHVPTIIVPLGLDQFNNAKKITHHGLGIEVNIEAVNNEQILTIIEMIINNESIHQKLEQMSSFFVRDSEDQSIINIIESMFSIEV